MSLVIEVSEGVTLPNVRGAAVQPLDRALRADGERKTSESPKGRGPPLKPSPGVQGGLAPKNDRKTAVDVIKPALSRTGKDPNLRLSALFTRFFDSIKYGRCL